MPNSKIIEFYLNLNDPITNLELYDSVEAYKVCMNLVKSEFRNWTIRKKKLTMKDKTWVTKTIIALIITIKTDKNYSWFLWVVKKAYNQSKILVKKTNSTSYKL